MKKTLQVIFGLAVGLFLIWWLFRGTPWPEVWDSMRNAHKGWLLASFVLVWLSFFMRVMRWSYIVRAGGEASFRRMFSATQIGFLANFTLPLRLGEAVRALVLTRLTRIPFTKSFAMVVLDRVTDVFGLIFVMFVSVIAFRPTEDIVLPKTIWAKPIPANFIRAGASTVGVFLLVMVAGLVLLYMRQALVVRISDAILGRVSKRLAAMARHLLEQFAQGLHVFRSPGDMAKSIGMSLLCWIVFVATYGAVIKAFGISFSWYAPFVTTAALSVVLSMPGAPGFVGQFHAGIMVGVMVVIPSLSLNDAKAMAIVAHLINLIPIAMAGAFCLIWEDLRLFELTRASGEAQHAIEHEEDA